MYSDLSLFDVPVGDVGSRLSLRIICLNERCLKVYDVMSLKNLLTSNLWLINVSETLPKSIFDSPSIVVGNPKWWLERRAC